MFSELRNMIIKKRVCWFYENEVEWFRKNQQSWVKKSVKLGVREINVKDVVGGQEGH